MRRKYRKGKLIGKRGNDDRKKKKRLKISVEQAKEKEVTRGSRTDQPQSWLRFRAGSTKFIFT